jgi:putative addiction module component (TIGR02574 family)
MTQLLQRAFDEAAKLPAADQNVLAERLLAELAEETTPLTDAQKQELDRRLAAHRADPSNVIPWEQVEKEALARMQP